MKLEWRPIVGYEGLYMVSNFGNVKSLERVVWNNRGYYKTVPEKVLKPQKNKDDYLFVALYKDGKGKRYKVHRLVCEAFLENPQNLPEVNHIDQNKQNNCVSNLEYCSRQYNVDYSLAKAVICIDCTTGLIEEFKSASKASKQLGIDRSHITACCKGRLKSAGGFYWQYADTKDQKHQEE